MLWVERFASWKRKEDKTELSVPSYSVKFISQTNHAIFPGIRKPWSYSQKGNLRRKKNSLLMRHFIL